MTRSIPEHSNIAGISSKWAMQRDYAHVIVVVKLMCVIWPDRCVRRHRTTPCHVFSGVILSYFNLNILTKPEADDRQK